VTTPADAMFSYVSPAQRVPRIIRCERSRRCGRGPWPAVVGLWKAVLAHGTAVDPPERLLRALLLQVLYSIRSERILMEQLDYDLLLRWLVGLSMDDQIWDPTVFTKNLDRLLRGHIAA
jgi:Transposase domain (DUF772)